MALRWLLLGIVTVVIGGCTDDPEAVSTGLVNVPSAAIALQSVDPDVIYLRRGEIVVVRAGERTVIAEYEFVQDLVARDGRLVVLASESDDHDVVDVFDLVSFEVERVLEVDDRELDASTVGLSEDGRYVAAVVRQRPGFDGAADVMVYDRTVRAWNEVLGLREVSSGDVVVYDDGTLYVGSASGTGCLVSVVEPNGARAECVLDAPTIKRSPLVTDWRLAGLLDVCDGNFLLAINSPQERPAFRIVRVGAEGVVEDGGIVDGQMPRFSCDYGGSSVIGPASKNATANLFDFGVLSDGVGVKSLNDLPD